jgi:hypothetical protein
LTLSAVDCHFLGDLFAALIVQVYISIASQDGSDYVSEIKIGMVECTTSLRCSKMVIPK